MKPILMRESRLRETVEGGAEPLVALPMSVEGGDGCSLRATIFLLKCKRPVVYQDKLNI